MTNSTRVHRLFDPYIEWTGYLGAVRWGQELPLPKFLDDPADVAFAECRFEDFGPNWWRFWPRKSPKATRRLFFGVDL